MHGATVFWLDYEFAVFAHAADWQPIGGVYLFAALQKGLLASSRWRVMREIFGRAEQVIPQPESSCRTVLFRAIFLIMLSVSGLRLLAQDSHREHILPWVVSGAAYNSTIELRLDFGDSASCQAAGPIADAGLIGRTFNVEEDHTVFIDVMEPADGSLAAGYVSLFCTGYVYAQVVYTRRIEDGMIGSEATVLSSGDGFWRADMTMDIGDRAREWFGLALANVSPFEQTYLIEFRNEAGEDHGFTTVDVPSRSSVGVVITNLLDDDGEPAFGERFRGSLQVRPGRRDDCASRDESGQCVEGWRWDSQADDFGVIGLHGNDGVFSTVPVLN